MVGGGGGGDGILVLVVVVSCSKGGGQWDLHGFGDSLARVKSDLAPPSLALLDQQCAY